ncbi:hypothetical protein [Amycolatopsis speibonae]|uniref:Uncharacterized protein n=1 Tax=Amycolatopsis speibonae TaxID=1450224 RepID=A0ABV7PCX2_9PSEU
MRGVVLLALAGTAVAFVVLTLDDWALLIGFGACAAVAVACLVGQFSARRWSGGGGGGSGGAAHKNLLTLVAEIVGIIGFLITLMMLMK